MLSSAHDRVAMTTLHTPLSRRQLLTATITGAAAFVMTGRAQEKSWQAGPVRHLLPGVSHDRLLLKASFVRPMTAPPILRAGGRKAIGLRLDTAGEFYSFDLAGLEPEHTYQLVLEEASGRSLCDPWPISTFPSPQATPKRFRLFVYTCAGGHPATINPDTKEPYWVSIANRRKLLLTGLSYKPDAMIAIGDHVYWDLRSPVGSVMLGNAPEAQKLVGQFIRDLPVLGTDNERRFKLVVTPQICDLYGTDFRSTPVFFVQDDHDYFENDEATEQMVTFPPDDFMLRLARATQRLYYPEFLPDASRPIGLPSSGAADRAAGVSESFGTLRYGKLLEIMMYDCRRYMSLAGPAGGFLPETAEAWVMRRMAAQETRHVVNLPSTPVGWSAGKWGEWYPDLLQSDGTLGVSKPKYLWQSGWNSAAQPSTRGRVGHAGHPTVLERRFARAGRGTDFALRRSRPSPQPGRIDSDRSHQHRPEGLAIRVARHAAQNAHRHRGRSWTEPSRKEWLLHHRLHRGSDRGPDVQLEDG